MLACSKCIHKKVCEFCKTMGFEDVVRANDFDCKDFMPADDVAEVKHGEWLFKHMGAGHYWECSECEFKNCVMPRTNYCPKCGAKMDGGNAE